LAPTEGTDFRRSTLPFNTVTPRKFLAEMYLARDAAATATKDAHLMTALAVLSALLVALCIGYQLGRRAGSTPSTWKVRTSRPALGRLAITLFTLVIARRIRKLLLAERGRHPAAVAWEAVWATRLVEPLQLLARGLPGLRVH
jgi:hypothetical protein